ncbi:hypothetical protein F5B22DRAFT_643627 [Xylaria bambusicola]|uniref:uncharacterized protein n=1 Tax=Xylaria bambusicola TaxID=326684 RepID=UPI0020085304|nr:uncharacterized protein F5B22DRAFT_643627 [Xylaria bambusicola]KAI0521463.1 hypothetical protein F5B22DRAFT_643627 [Xylaria bambusicola]
MVAPLPISHGGVQVTVIGIVFLLLSFLAIGLRLWSRRISCASIAFNDHMAILATLFTAALIALTSFFGLGHHVHDIPIETFTLFQKINIAIQLIWASANTCVKISILSLYTALFPGRKFARICYTVAAFSIAFWISVVLEGFVLCTPVQFNWDRTVPNGVCARQDIAYLLAGIMNLLIDAIVVSLPVNLLLGLKMPLQKKLGVIAMFSLGMIICIITLRRIILIRAYYHLTDKTYNTTKITTYSILEPTLGVMNSCLPVMKPALARIYRAVRRTPRETNNTATDLAGFANRSTQNRGTFKRFDDCSLFHISEDTLLNATIQADKTTANASVPDPIIATKHCAIDPL